MQVLGWTHWKKKIINHILRLKDKLANGLLNTQHKTKSNVDKTGSYAINSPPSKHYDS